MLMLPVAGPACRKATSSGQRYDLKGKVISVDKIGRTASIAHGEIKGYMPAMTMEFRFKDDWPLVVLVPGDQISGTLVVDGVSSWIEDPQITKEAFADPNAKETSSSAEPKPGDEVPDFPLVNQDGKRIHLAQYRGKALVLTFIYTRCPLPEYCTLMSNNFHEIDQELRKLPDLFARSHLLSISIDPEYDKPGVLRSYGAAHTEGYQEEKFEHWEFAGGTAEEVKNIAQFFGMRYFRDTQSGEDQIIHGLRTAIIGGDGKLVKLYRGNEWKPKEILDDLKSLPEPKR
jgi:protein SCO1